MYIYILSNETIPSIRNFAKSVNLNSAKADVRDFAWAQMMLERFPAMV